MANNDVRITKLLDRIDNKLDVLTRVEERVDLFLLTLDRHDKKIADHDSRLRTSELTQADYKNNTNDINTLKTNIDELRDSSNVGKGKSEVSKDVYKWCASIVSGTLVWAIIKVASTISGGA